MTITIDRAGRLVIPKRLRERFNLVPGAQLEIEPDGDGMRLRAAGGGNALIRSKDVLIHHGPGKVNMDLVEFIDRERKARSEQVVSVKGKE